MENLNHFKSSTGEPVAPRFTETEVSAMLVAPSPAENQMALIPRGETPQIQEQNYSRGYDLFSQVFQKEHSPMHHLGISNEYNASGSQAIRTTERSALPSPLQSDPTINSHRGWNSAWPQPSQVSAVGANASQYYHNYMQYAPVGNPNHNYQSQVAGHNGYGDQLVDPVQIPKVEQSMVHQVDPANANKVTPPLLRGTVPESSSARAHFANPFVNMNNQNAKPMLPSADQSKGLIPLQNQTQNLLMGRDLRREVSMEAAKNFKVGEGRAERSWDAGEGPSAKRLKHINSPPKEGPNQGPAPQEANNAPENPKLLDLINNTGNNGGFVSNSLYDPAFETLGLAVDPHIRLFEALAARGEKGYRMFD